MRYHDRTESWFELVSVQPPLRRDLRPLAVRLQECEGTGPDAAMRWAADAPDQPIPELYFGPPSAQAYGEISRELAPTGLAAERIVTTVRSYLQEAGPAGGVTRAV